MVNVVTATASASAAASAVSCGRRELARILLQRIAQNDAFGQAVRRGHVQRVLQLRLEAVGRLGCSGKLAAGRARRTHVFAAVGGVGHQASLEFK